MWIILVVSVCTGLKVRGGEGEAAGTVIQVLISHEVEAVHRK